MLDVWPVKRLASVDDFALQRCIVKVGMQGRPLAGWLPPLAGTLIAARAGWTDRSISRYFTAPLDLYLLSHAKTAEESLVFDVAERFGRRCEVKRLASIVSLTSRTSPTYEYL